MGFVFEEDHEDEPMCAVCRAPTRQADMRPSSKGDVCKKCFKDLMTKKVYHAGQ